jgi:UDP-glucose 4-epimerase
MVHGQGYQTRDYVFVDDIVDAMVAASTAPGINNLVINVGIGKETSLRDLVRLVLEVVGKPVEVIDNPRTDPGVSRMCADLTLAREKLNYQPRVELPEGLRLTVDRDPRFKRETQRPTA